MKKILLTILMLLLFASWANASPFLICDPQEKVEYYEITGDISFPRLAAQPDGSIKYDLDGIAEQDYSIEVKACNKWGCSDPAPFVFTKKLPSVPSSLRVEP